ncbi:hypothetical protein LJC53_04755 [Bacteroidales bacterium OttesenSCG-928-C03]|nr:hypothetical protein [Bacteroidales bacterium OttesenSCG-928-C03]MDL2326112.1 hypothetical protein [Bacteroidales bacterium OttesenSCG-928-A14]
MNKVKTEFSSIVKIACIVLVILKLFNLINWGWLLVLLPFIFMTTYPLLLLLILWCAYLFRKIKKPRRTK